VRCAAEGDGPWVDHPICAAGSAVADRNGAISSHSIKAPERRGCQCVADVRERIEPLIRGVRATSRDEPVAGRGLRGVRFSVVRIGEAGDVLTPCERVVALCRRLERSHTASGSLLWP
jgi:hypothetical protein